MPDTVQFGNGNQIINRYAADGRKLGTEYFTRVPGMILQLDTGQVISQSYVHGVVNQNGTAYIDNKEYNTLNGNWTLTTLSRVHNAEGYASYNTSPYLGFIYNRTDHLGNIREVWHASSKTTIQRTQYYPSGLPWETTPAYNLSTQPFKYNGKEFVEMNGYDTYDYGWRGYYPAMGSFQTIDPLAEKYYSISPYAYCAGNPVRFVDVNGMWFGVTSLFFERSIGAGLAAGGNSYSQSGYARDSYGITRFRISGTIQPKDGKWLLDDANSAAGKINAKYLLEASAGLAIGATQSTAKSFAESVSSQTFNVPGIELKGKLGVGVSFSDGSLSLSVGPQIGAIFTSQSLEVFSISATKNEFSKLNITDDFKINKIYSISKNGEVIGFTGILNTIDENGDIVKTKVSSGVGFRDGKNVPDNLWMTDEYRRDWEKENQK